MSPAMKALAAVTMVAASLLTACGPDFERMEFSGVKQSDLGGSINTSKLDVPEGMVVKSRIVAWNDDNEPMRLAIRVADPSVVEVSGIITPHDYAFIGLKKGGRTQVQFLADGEVVLTIDAEVTAQPELPEL